MPRQPEIKAYLEGVVHKHGLQRRIHCNKQVDACTWNDHTMTWTLKIHDVKTGEEWIHETNIIFNCIGGLDDPRPLDVPGKETFEGPIFHTRKWDDSVALKDKRVAVIGNGCTAVQMVPALINEVGVKSVTQFVRSKHWVFPSLDMEYPEPVRWAFRNIPGFLWLHRIQIHLFAESAWPAFYMDEKGAKLRNKLQKVTEDYMRQNAPEKYHDLIIPEWEVGCKRRIFDYGYMQVLNKENMTLKQTPIQEIVPEGIKTHDGIDEVDVILIANGFDLKRTEAPMTIVGKNGENLYKRWNEQGGAGCYSCVGVADFPNMLFIAGPNTITGHSSVVLAAENTTNLALRVLKPVFDNKAATVEPYRAAEKKWNADVQREGSKRSWSMGGCTNWYVDDNGWNATLYPWSQTDLWWRCVMPKWSNWYYQTSSGRQYRYWGLDRFTKPGMTVFLAIAAAIWFWRAGVKIEWRRLLAKIRPGVLQRSA